MIRSTQAANAHPIPVLLTVRELGSGGIERDVTKLAIGLDRLRFTPYVATYQVGGLRDNELRRAGVPIFHLQLSSFKSPKIISTSVRFGRFVRGRKIRILHAFDATAAFGVPLARLLGVPAVLASTLGHRSLLDARTRRQFQFTDHLVDAIVVNCEAMRRHLTEDYSVSNDRIELCYNGVDIKEFYPAIAQASKPDLLANASLVIGTVCVLRPEKALHILLEAFARIRHLRPDMMLLIVGSGTELHRLEQNSLRLGIQDACVFMPAVSSVAPLMRAIDIFVSCSSSEAFSNSILEAMASGCSIVGSRVGGTPELISEERGVLFTAGDVEDLALKLDRLIRDAAWRKMLGTKAAEFARKNLTIEIAVQRTMEIYETLLCRKNALRSSRAFSR